MKAARRMSDIDIAEGAREEETRSDELTFSSGICVGSATHSPNQQRLLLAFSSVSFVRECSKVVILPVPAPS